MARSLTFIFILLLSVDSLAEELQARALLIARQQAVLSSQITGKLTEVNVDLGQAFAKGDKLVVFDCSVQEATRERIRSVLKAASIKVSLQKKLRELGSLSQLEFAEAEAAEQQARAELKEADANIRMCTVNAPFSGRVVARMVDAFETVRQGDELIEVINDKSLAVDLLVSSSWINWLKKGLPFEIQISETGQKVQAEVEEVGAKIDPGSQTIAVRGRLTGQVQGLIAGMTGQALFSATQ